MNRVGPMASQFGAALIMLGDALWKGHAHGLWTAPSPTGPFWQVGYHALFYTDLYLCLSEQEFRPPACHRDGMHVLGQAPAGSEPPGPGDLQDWAGRLREETASRLRASGFEGPSGFPWITGFAKEQLHVYNLRHLQHHTGQLAERIRAAGGPPVQWVGLDH